MKWHIEDVKKQIEEYNTKIHELLSILKDISNKNLVEQPKIYFDKDLFEKDMKSEQNRSLIPDSLPLFLVVFYCCIGLLLGKLLHKIL